MRCARSRGSSAGRAGACRAALSLLALLHTQAGARRGGEAPAGADTGLAVLACSHAGGRPWALRHGGDGGAGRQWRPLPRATCRAPTGGRGDGAVAAGAVLPLQGMRGGRRVRVRIGKNRWIDPRKIVRPVHPGHARKRILSCSGPRSRLPATAVHAVGAAAGTRVHECLPVGVHMRVLTVLRIGPNILTRRTHLVDLQPEEDASDDSDPDKDPNITVVCCKEAGRRIGNVERGLGAEGDSQCVSRVLRACSCAT